MHNTSAVENFKNVCKIVENVHKWKCCYCIQLKPCGKWRKCSLWAISPFGHNVLKNYMFLFIINSLTLNFSYRSRVFQSHFTFVPHDECVRFIRGPWDSKSVQNSRLTNKVPRPADRSLQGLAASCLPHW